MGYSMPCRAFSIIAIACWALLLFLLVFFCWLHIQSHSYLYYMRIIIIEHRSHQFRRRVGRESGKRMPQCVWYWDTGFVLDSVLWFSKIIIAHCVPICEWDFITDAFTFRAQQFIFVQRQSVLASLLPLPLFAFVHCVQNCWCIVCRAYRKSNTETKRTKSIDAKLNSRTNAISLTHNSRRFQSECHFLSFFRVHALTLSFFRRTKH